MSDMKYNPGEVLGDKIIDMNRQQLCELVSKLCRRIRAEAGSRAFRGGVYPENIDVDESGNVSVGLSRQSGWDGQELQFIAPELYWNGQRSPASDVYSLGMLLYYAVNNGRLPYDGECENPQLRRMGGDDFPAPRAAGRRLGEIIEKATHFKAAERYQSVEEMQIMLDSCVKNLYLSDTPSAEAIFNKSDDDLTDIERLMVGIIERGEEEVPPEEETEAQTPELPEVPAAEEPAAEEPVPEETPAGEPETVDGAAREEDTGIPAGETTVPEEPEEIKVFEPSLGKRQEREAEKAVVRKPVPILTEEKNPELEPVVPKQAPVTPAVQYGKSAQREKKIAEEVKKRKRKPMVLVLVLCALLVVAAIIINAMLKDFAWNDEGVKDVVTETPPASTSDTETESGGQTGGAVVVIPSSPPATETPAVEEKKESTYQVFKEDVSWTEARDRCTQLGGHLAVISSQEELDKIVKLADEAGISRVWIGCHRIEGTLVWENTDEVTFYPWDTGEPSYEDSYDGVAEDYVMLWYHNGWVYNDSRNDPVGDYPQWYSGTVGFVCEFDG